MSMMRLLIIAVIVFKAISSRSTCQDNEQEGPRFMFWNVENAFDVQNDPATDDDDFLPQGIMRWNEKRYWKKINDIYKTITAVGEWTPPDVIAFCEVENRKILEDIVDNTYLSRYEYGIIHEDSPDERGIDACLIYRKDRLKSTGYRYLIPEGMRRSDLGTRTVLYAGFESGNDTIHLFFNHWPSKSGGVLAGEELRMRIASMVSSKADSILEAAQGRAKIIIAGDFNCSPEDKAIKILTSGQKFINLSGKLSGEPGGTYRFRGIWEMLDQVIVSDFFMNCTEGAYIDKKSARIFSPFFLLSKEPNYPGLTPFSMYRGRRYQGGISDHLPVIVDCRLWPQMLPDAAPVQSLF